MLIVIVATGNHFFFDAAAGGIVVAVAYAVARALSVRESERDDSVIPSAKRFEERRAHAAGQTLDIAA
jgi:hypothetical protein